MSWFDPIKQAFQNVETDFETLFGPGGLTQANLVKLGLDIEAGLQVDINQVQAGLQAINAGIIQAIPIAQQAIADAQIVAGVYPAVAPFIAEMQVGLTAVQALETLLSANSGTTQTIPDGIKELSSLASAVAGWAAQAIAAIKAAA